MTERYFVETPIEGRAARLEGAEAHHLLHVMRARVDSEVVLFDGSGDEFRARVERLGRRDVQLRVLDRQAADRELSVPLVIAAALPKGERQRWLVEKLTELGTTRLVPLQCERSVAQPAESALARLRRAVIEASKQCGRNRLMKIAPPQPCSEFLKSAPVDAVRLLADSGGKPARRAAEHLADTRAVYAAVGPEGGFSPAEIELAGEMRWQPVSLGPRILRVETAAAALAAVLAGGLS